MYIVFIAVLLALGCYYYCLYLKRTNENFYDLENIQPKVESLKRFTDLKFVLFINLDERSDRLQESLLEFAKLNLRATRVRAIKHKSGSLGCTLSHIKALEIANSKQWDHVMICEDDVQFTQNKLVFVQQFEKFLSRHKDWDVITLGPNIFEATFIDDSCARIFSSWCTTCYIVRRHYYKVLLHNFKVAAQKSSSGRTKHEIDVHWHSLQRRDQWFTILPMVASQRPSISDVNIRGNTKQMVNYKKIMLDSFLRKIQGYPANEKVKNHAMFDEI